MTALASAEKPLGRVSDRLTPILAGAAIVLLSAAAGYRWFGEGLDHVFYVEFWESFETLETARTRRFEPGFVWLAWAAKSVGLDFSGFYLLLVAFSLSVKACVIWRHTRWPAAAFLAYLLLFYGVHEYTQIRQAVAIAFALLGVSAFLRGNWPVAGLWILVGALFQTSVLALGLGLGIYVLLARPLLGVLAAVAVLLAIPLAGTIDPLLLIERFNPIATSYLDNPDLMAVQSLFNAQNLLLALAIVLVAPRTLARGEPADRLALFFCTLGLVVYAIIIDVPVFSSRLLEMFSVFLVVLAFRAPRPTLEALAMPVVLTSGLWAVSQGLQSGIYG